MVIKVFVTLVTGFAKNDKPSISRACDGLLLMLVRVVKKVTDKQIFDVLKLSPSLGLSFVAFVTLKGEFPL